MTTIADRIRSARIAADLTQQQLADAIPTPGGRQQVSGWESGLRTPRRATLERIAEVLDVKAGWLMFGE